MARLDTLAAAWPGAALPRGAAGPLAALAVERLAGGDAGVRAAAALCARARRLDPHVPTPPGLELEAARLAREDLAAGRLDEAALLVVLGCEAGVVDPGRVAEQDLLRLAAAGSLERALAADRTAPFARLLAALGEAALARGDPEATRAARAARAAERLRATRPDLPPAAAAVAAAQELRLEASLDPGNLEARAEELAGACGPEGWRVARQAARLLRASPARALPWARRAVEELARADVRDAEQLAAASEALVELLFDAGQVAEAEERLAAALADGLLSGAAAERLRERRSGPR
ncbi:MAG: hypothetical protein M9894_31210 [Planctomycetes bacterium]|nr:hypothetical protein [Planctomycetota bacterium]